MKKRNAFERGVTALGICFLLVSVASCSREEKLKQTRGTIPKTYTIDLRGMTAQYDRVAGFKSMGFEVSKSQRADGTDTYLPKLKIADGALVDVHVGISNGMIHGSATLKWKYTAATRTLRLEGEDTHISLTGSEEDFRPGSNDWYITGIIGGQLLPNGYGVDMSPKELPPSTLQGQSGEHFELDVPFGFKWTKLEVRYGGGENHGTPIYAIGKTSVKFVPMGSVIRLSFQHANLPFKVSEFRIINAPWDDAGTFNFTDPTNSTDDYFPVWEENFVNRRIQYYRLQPWYDENPSHPNVNPTKTPWIWVMPKKSTVPGKYPYVLVVGQGRTDGAMFGHHFNKEQEVLYYSGARPEEPISHFSGRGRPKSGRTYTMKIYGRAEFNANPLGFVEKYNLAGSKPYHAPSQERWIYPLSHPWDGYRDELMLANRNLIHDNRSGTFLNWYMLYGQEDARWNPSKRSLHQQDIGTYSASPISYGLTRMDTYWDIPEIEDWWAIFGPNEPIYFNQNNNHITRDYGRIGGTELQQRYTGRCEFTSGEVDPYNSSQRVVYAIRYLKAEPGDIRQSIQYHEAGNGRSQREDYPLLESNIFATAYKYTKNYTHPQQIKVEAIYLGETRMALHSVSTAYDVKVRWDLLRATYSSPIYEERIFPLSGYVEPNSSNPFGAGTMVKHLDYAMHYWSGTAFDNEQAYVLTSSPNRIDTSEKEHKRRGLSVRLFRQVDRQRKWEY